MEKQEEITHKKTHMFDNEKQYRRRCQIELIETCLIRFVRLSGMTSILLPI